MGYKRKSSQELLEQFKKLKNRLSELDMELSPKRQATIGIKTDIPIEDIERRLALLENDPSYCLVVSCEMSILYINQVPTGYTKEDFLGKPLTDFVHEEFKDSISGTLESVIRTGQPESNICRGIAAENKYAWYEVYIRPLFDEGNVSEVAIYGIDITERINAEDESNQTVAFLRTFIATLPNPVFIKNKQGIYIDCNKKFAELFALDVDGVKGMTVFDVAPPNLAEIYHVKDSELFESPGMQSYEGQLQTYSGEIRDVVINKATYNDADGEVAGIIGIIIDITDRKAAESDLARANDFLQAIYNSSETCIFAVDVMEENEYLYVSINNAYKNLFGILEDDIIGKSPRQVMHLFGDETLDFTIRTFNACVSQGSTHESEISLEIDRRQTWWLTRTIPLKDSEGNVYRLIGNAVDITEYKRIQQALTDSEEKYRLLVENQTDLLVQFDLQGKLKFISQSVCRMFEMTEDELLRVDIADFIHEDDRASVFESFEELKKPPHTSYVEERVMTPSGWRWLAWRNTAIFNEFGEIEGATGAGRDITDMKRAEDALRESEERNRALSESTNEALFFSDQGICIEANEAASNMFGYEHDEFIGKFGTDIIADESKETVRHNLLSGYDKPYRAMGLRKDGSTFMAEIHGKMCTYKGKQVRVTAIRDISAQVKAEAALRKSEQELAMFLDNFPGIAYQTEILGPNQFQYTLLRGDVESITGYSVNEIIAEQNKWDSLVYGEDGDDYVYHYGRLLREEVPSIDCIYRIVTKAGEIKWLRDISKVLNLEGKKFIHGTVYDITSRKAAEDEVRLFKTISDNANYGTVIMHVDGSIIYINNCFAEMYRSPRELIIGRNVRDIHNEEQSASLQQRLESLKSKGRITAEEVWFTRDDGSVFPTLASFTAISDARGNPSHFVATVIDNSKLKRMEEELHKAEKLESIGVLAGGIAHDFNNILTAIMGNVSLVRFEMPPDSEMAEMLAEVEKATFRAKDLTQQLLTFSKGGAPIKKAENIGQVVMEAAKFVLHGSNVKPVFAIAEDIRPVEIDRTQISQVVNNLTLNADQAMPDGGIIKFLCRNKKLVDNNSLGLPPGEYVEIIVEDEGIGIHQKHIHKIFDPFFTTKQKGNGLGLASTYSIIKKHGGHITVASELTAGTTFTFYLPASDQVPADSEIVQSADYAGQGRILIMDDEAAVRRLAENLVKRLGYQSSTVTCGEEAIELYRQSIEENDPFDVVLLDLTVPGGMGGLETLKHLKNINAKVRAIVSSGYSNDPVVADFIAHGFLGSVCKPYRINELAKMLKSVID
ncbi:MAG: PAS domain S-box protein [Candidatus Zixiibacteriota bacterium]